jgi:hypothetical protein
MAIDQTLRARLTRDRPAMRRRATRIPAYYQKIPNAQNPVAVRRAGCIALTKDSYNY